MTTYMIRRLIQALVVLILMSIFVFFIMRLLPGDPLLIYVSQSEQLRDMPAEKYEALRHEYGLDRPLIVQYLDWAGGVLHGDFGHSLSYNDDVGRLIGQRLPVTLLLGVLSLIISATLGITVGIIAAIRRNSWIDKLASPLAYLGVTVPIFWLGILLVYTFGLKLHWLPTYGFTWPLDDFWLSIRRLVMPVICLCVFSLAANVRLMRSSMLEVIRQDYIRTAWSKGLRERTIIVRHALRNGLIAIVTLIGMEVGHIFGGAVLVETVFAIPGIGRLMVTSILNHDYVVVQGVALVIAAAIFFVNLVVDLSYGWFDPRIRYS